MGKRDGDVKGRDGTGDLGWEEDGRGKEERRGDGGERRWE